MNVLKNVITDKIKYIIFFVDSQAALLALKSSTMTSVLVLDTKKILSELALKTRRLTLVWIKAHVGHEGNEHADELAKQGTTEDNKNNTILPPITNIKEKINKYFQKQWDQEWTSYPEARHTKEFYKCNDADKAKKV